MARPAKPAGQVRAAVPGRPRYGLGRRTRRRARWIPVRASRMPIRCHRRRRSNPSRRSHHGPSGHRGVRRVRNPRPNRRRTSLQRRPNPRRDLCHLPHRAQGRDLGRVAQRAPGRMPCRPQRTAPARRRGRMLRRPVPRRLAFRRLSRPAFRRLSRPAFRRLSRPAFRRLSRPAFRRLSRPAFRRLSRPAFRRLSRLAPHGLLVLHRRVRGRLVFRWPRRLALSRPVLLRLQALGRPSPRRRCSLLRLRRRQRRPPRHRHPLQRRVRRSPHRACPRGRVGYGFRGTLLHAPPPTMPIPALTVPKLLCHHPRPTWFQKGHSRRRRHHH